MGLEAEASKVWILERLVDIGRILEIGHVIDLCF